MPNLLRCDSTRHAQRSFDRFDDLRIHFHPRIERAEFIVKNLPHQRSVTKDAPSHGHRDGGAVSLREEVANHHRGYIGEFPAGACKNLSRQVIAVGSNCREKCGKVRRGDRVGGAGEVDE